VEASFQRDESEWPSAIQGEMWETAGVVGLECGHKASAGGQHLEKISPLRETETMGVDELGTESMWHEKGRD
jgi:hypothetical protein